MKLRERIIESLLEIEDYRRNGEINYKKSADDIGVTRQTVMGWAKGTVNVYDMKLSNLIKLAEKTNHQLSWFLDEKDEQIPDVSTPAFSLLGEINETANHYHDFMEEQKRNLDDMAMQKHDNQPSEQDLLLNRLITASEYGEITDEIATDIMSYLNVKLASTENKRPRVSFRVKDHNAKNLPNAMKVKLSKEQINSESVATQQKRPNQNNGNK